MSGVRVAEAGDATVVGRVLAEGFGDDPVLSWVFSEPERASKLRTFFSFLAAEALVPLGATYLVDGACASWTPPDSPPWPEERGRRFSALLSRECPAEDLRRLAVLDEATAAHHPTPRHWYLGTIAALPDRRGRGLGSALLRRSLAVVDASGLPASLESTNPRNVPLYERHGFRVTGRIDLPGGPSLIPMWREVTPPAPG